MASTRRSSRRSEKGNSAAEDHGTCWLCNGVTTMDDYDWLCLCTAQKKRVHKVCVTHRSSLGGPALRPCPHCGMGNSAAEIEHARASSRVVIVGAGAAGLAAARWLKERGFNPLVLEARDRVGGRIHTVEMEHGAPVDLGAAYIHGCDASYNPVRPPRRPHLPTSPSPLSRPARCHTPVRPARGGAGHAHRAAPHALLRLASELGCNRMSQRLQPYAAPCRSSASPPSLACASTRPPAATAWAGASCARILHLAPRLRPLPRCPNKPRPPQPRPSRTAALSRLKA